MNQGLARRGVFLQEDPEATGDCVHGVPTDMECIHCLLAYFDFEFNRLMEFVRFLEKFLEALLGENWKQMTLEEVQKLPNLPIQPLKMPCITE
jgi:hypothetical protein